MLKLFSKAQGRLNSPFHIPSLTAYCTVFKKKIDTEFPECLKHSGNICDLQKK